MRRSRSGWMISVVQEREILRMLKQGRPARSIARACGVGRMTVYRLKAIGCERPRGPGSMAIVRNLDRWRNARLKSA